MQLVCILSVLLLIQVNEATREEISHFIEQYQASRCQGFFLLCLTSDVGTNVWGTHWLFTVEVIFFADLHCSMRGASTRIPARRMLELAYGRMRSAYVR